MALIVQKYGGTSVADAEKIKNVARRIVQTKSKGDEVVVVLNDQHILEGKLCWTCPKCRRQNEILIAQT